MSPTLRSTSQMASQYILGYTHGPLAVVFQLTYKRVTQVSLSYTFFFSFRFGSSKASRFHDSPEWNADFWEGVLHLKFASGTQLFPRSKDKVSFSFKKNTRLNIILVISKGSQPSFAKLIRALLQHLRALRRCFAPAVAAIAKDRFYRSAGMSLLCLQKDESLCACTFLHSFCFVRRKG